MSNRAKFLYWLIAGGIMGFGLIAFGLGLLPTLLGGILAVYGVRLFGTRGFWMTLVGMGVLPMLLLLSVYLKPRSCGPGCDIYVPDSTLYGAMLFGAIALVGLIWGLIELRQSRAA